MGTMDAVAGLTPLTPWYVGLPCRKCGQRVKQNDGGVFWKPLKGEPWAECYTCRQGGFETKRMWGWP